MLTTLRCLLQGANAKAEDRVRAAFSLDLIDQKIREAGDGLRAAKAALASLIQRERAEARHIAMLEGRIADLSQRALAALQAGQEALVAEAAEAIAVMENELALRRETATRLAARILRLRSSVEATNRRLIDLKQGAIAARAVRQEQAIQSRLMGARAMASPMAEAEDLIAGVLAEDDPLEHATILTEIDRGLTHEDVAERLAAQGFGQPMKSTAATVLARLQSSLN